MSIINGFLSTWSNARAAFGEGSPQTGKQYDSSAALRQMETDLESAAPGSRWTGSAATNYDAANTEHRRVIGQLAGLDQRLAAEVDNSAQVVDAGRRNLDAVRQWVVDAAASVPPGRAGENMKMAIAQKGLSQLQEILQKSNGDMNAIGGRIRGLDPEFQALGNQRFAKEGPQFAVGDEKKDDKEEENNQKQWAKETVEGALNGNAKDAAEVDRVLDSFSDAQIAGKETLNSEQQQILSQMQYQTHNKSIQELSEIRDKLGDKKGILANSWQLVSDPDIKFPKTDNMSELNPWLAQETVSGSEDLLPTSIQDTLDTPAFRHIPNPEGYPLFELPTENDLKTVASFVADGDVRFQQGTQLDDGLMTRAAEILDRGGTSNEIDGVVQAIFNSAGRDAIIDHKFITGENGRDFLDDIAMHSWTDNGAAASTLTDWVDDAANGSNPDMDRMAGETAYAVADYLGDNRGELANMALAGDTTLGAINPDLVQGYAEALAPYQEAMIGDRTDPAPGFKPLDGQDQGDFSHARKVFSVIDQDPTAAKSFNEHAYQSILQYQQETENAVRAGGPADGTALGNAGRMLGVVNGAADMAQVDSSYEMRRAALEGAIDEVTGKLPIVDKLTEQYLLNQLLGDGTFDRVTTHSFAEVENLQRWAVASELFSRGAVPPTEDLRNFMIGDRLMTPEEAQIHRPGQMETYYQELRDYAALPENGWADALSTFGDEYEQGKGTK